MNDKAGAQDFVAFQERGQAALETFKRLQAKLDRRREVLALRSILGDGLLDDLAGLHATSAGSTQALPPAAADRIQLIGQAVWCLMGSYSDEGIRRWFGRRRPQLRGKSPAEHLGNDWSANSPAAKRVLALAAALIGPN